MQHERTIAGTRRPPARKAGLAAWVWALSILGLIAALLLLFAAPVAASDEPEITSQGFKISETQEGLLGRFERLRVRIEAPKRIETLIIKERSYEVDLATTPERSHFALFGLDKRVRQHQDVTLDFSNYINRKLEAGGRYAFRISVTDRDGQSATARLLVEVREEKPAAQAPDPAALPVEQAVFEFRRIGKQAVSGAESFALAWKTVDDVEVVIALSKLDGTESKFLTLAEPDYAEIETKGQLIEMARKARRLERLELPTANNEAAGSIFGIERQDELFIFKIMESSTSLSELGTTVTLVGEYKH